jgi:hypothetical protein
MKASAFAAALFGLVLGSSAAPPENPGPKNPAPEQAQPQYKLKAWDGDPRSPESMNFQLSPPRGDMPTPFLQLGEFISRKTEGGEIDVSELTLTDTAAGKKTVLVRRLLRNRTVYTLWRG